MQHIKPTSKGDPLCPLGFHPQVRWPTRCKRCFRDYKEHGNRNKEQDYKLKRSDTTASSPSLSNWNTKSGDDKFYSNGGVRSWTSTNNLNTDSSQKQTNHDPVVSSKGTSSWTSTPDLNKLSDNTKADTETTFCVTLPRRRPSSVDQNEGEDYRRTQYTVRRRTNSTLSKQSSLSNDVPSDDITKNDNDVSSPFSNTHPLPSSQLSDSKEDSESDIFTDAASTIRTDDSDTTLVNSNHLQDELENLKLELSSMKLRCEKAEKEKNEMLMRRVASLDNAMSTKASTSELTRLQEKVNNLTEACESLREEKKTLMMRIKEMNEFKKSNKVDSSSEVELLKAKLQTAESLCEELMDENEDMKKELRDMEEEIEEMQDNFRETQDDEYSTIKKELELTGKNCRILSFKLKKAERKAEQLEADKLESERKSREAIQKLQKELDELNDKVKYNNSLDVMKKTPLLGNIPKTPSGEKVSRASLTRGGSQEDPAQLLRDLQDSVEREADLREQLRYAEEEAENLRKKVSRVEDDNESLILQLKKMATKVKHRKLSPTHSRLSPDSRIEKDEGISDDDDPAELRVLLELNEQESTVLRKKVEELEVNCNTLKRKASDLQEKLLAKEQKATKVKSKDLHNIKADKELQELRTKLEEKEHECSQLSSEIAFLKKSKNLQRTRSLDGEPTSIDVQRQLKIVEQEASILRSKLLSLESENEKLQNENKKLSITNISRKSNSNEAELKSKIKSLEKKVREMQKSDDSNVEPSVSEIKELQQQLSILKGENKRLKTSLTLLEDGKIDQLISLHKSRIPRIVEDSTPKSVLKHMIEDLESEIVEILSAHQKFVEDMSETKRAAFQLEEANKKLEKLSLKMESSKVKFEKEKEKLVAEKRRIETARSKMEDCHRNEKQQLVQDKQKLEEEKNKLNSKAEILVDKITNVEKELNIVKQRESEINKKLVDTQYELAEKTELVTNLKKQLEDAEVSLKNASSQKTEISEKTKKLVEFEKKVRELEDKLKKSDRLVLAKREKLLTVEKEIESMKKENENLKSSIKEERNKTTSTENELKRKIEELEKTIESDKLVLEEKTSKINELETRISKEFSAKSDLKNSAASVRFQELETRLSTSQDEIKTLMGKLKKIEKEKKLVEEKSLTTNNNLKIEINKWKTNADKLELDLQMERASLTECKIDHEKSLKEKENELTLLKKKINNAGEKPSVVTKLESLTDELISKKKEYDELTTKYEQLEEEHLRIKSQLTLTKEQMQSQVMCTQRELVSVQNELRTLRETFNTRQDNWIKEKLQLEEKLKQMNGQLSNSDSYKLECKKFKSLIESKNSEFDKIQKEWVAQRNQIEHMRKENEELQKQLDDFDKVVKVQRNMVADATALEAEVSELRSKLHNEEKSRKVEIASLKIGYENHVSTLSKELKDVQAQLMRFKHERNTYKHLLENVPKPTETVIGNEIQQTDELRTQVATLEQQISCMEDELSEARVESSRIKTEYVSAKSAWEVKMSEMASRINQLEEDRLLQSGRTNKIAGLKTRMELVWQKEREEQNRLLQETSTLARDLRQTLFEVERERDKERLDMKRKIDQMKKIAEEEQDETRKKLHELQIDLLELRDAHAKLRTTNEKLRRERDRMEKEKELLRQARSTTNDQESEKLSQLVNLVNELVKTVPTYLGDKSLPPIPGKRQTRGVSLDDRDVSRESSISYDDPTSLRFYQTLQKLYEVSQDLSYPEEKSSKKNKARRSFITKKSASQDDPSDVNIPNRYEGSIRKCISLEQTAANSDQRIWKVENKSDSVSSIQSDDETLNARGIYQFYDQPFDSRVSSSSTKSEMLSSTYEKKKKRSLMDKIKKLTRSSRSVSDEPDSSKLNPDDNQFRTLSISSISSVYDETSPKKDLRDLITNIFKDKKSTGSRNSSMERTVRSAESDQEPAPEESVPERSENRVVESKTLPRSLKDKQLVAVPPRVGATMPRNLVKKKPKPL